MYGQGGRGPQARHGDSRSDFEAVQLLQRDAPNPIRPWLRWARRRRASFSATIFSSREAHEGLNVVENWNATNDFICYGRQGELATNSREQQEIVTLSLQLLQNCLMLINTILVERTIEREGL